jgi:phosphotransferase system enzyme I (PtsP)
VTLQMNAGLLVDLPQLSESGASGIGLFRTELQFMIASTMPKVDEQESLYRSVLRQAGGRPVTFRTLDIGGDKVVPYFRSAEEENPALGWRAIRLSLDRPGLLRTQLQGVAESCGRRRAQADAADDNRGQRASPGARIAEQGSPASLAVRLPAAAQACSSAPCWKCQACIWQLDELMEEVDFVSVGSNDLFQFVMAVDRGNSRVADRFDPLGRPFLRVLQQIVEAAGRTNTPLTLCGEIAGKSLSAMALLGIGFRNDLDVARSDRAGQVDADVAGSGQTGRGAAAGHCRYGKWKNGA